MARRILLADDSVTAQNMGRRILSDAGYEVITVNNGSAALKKVAEQPPDVIVLDVYMPGYGGLEVCQRLKEVPETARIPILLTVGKLEPFKPDEARRVRADAFIIKPFEATELLAALTKLEDKIVPQADAPKSSKVRSIAPESARSEEDTGWKNRLSIPPGGKGRSPEKLEADDFGQSATEVAKDGPKEVKKESTKEAEKVAAEETLKPVLVTEEKPAAAAESAQEAKKPEEVPAAKVQEITSSEAKPAEVAQEKDAEKETAAVASAVVVPEKIEIPAPAAEVPAAPSAVAPKGPRWVAESVTLSADDTAFPLEKEMEKSLAAVAALKAGLEAVEAVPVQQAPAEAPAEQAKVESQSVTTNEAVETKPTETKPVEIAETKTPETENPAPAVAVASEAGAKPADAVAEVTATTKPEAYAAAASASMGVSESSTTEARPIAGASENTAAAEVASGNKQQLADAWEKWQNVRETVLNSPVAEQITEVAAASLKNAAELAGDSEFSTYTASNPTNIANIVDSVLAELKPKLVEEIARKLGKGKK